MNVIIDGWLTLCISPVTDWQCVRGIRCLCDTELDKQKKMDE